MNKNDLRTSILSTLCLGSALLLGLATTNVGATPVNIVINGSFEDGFAPWDGLGSLWLGFSAADGRDFGSVDAFSPVSQVLLTKPGQQYHIKFAMAGPASGGTYVAQVFWDDQMLGIGSWDSSRIIYDSNGISDFGWT